MFLVIDLCYLGRWVTSLSKPGLCNHLVRYFSSKFVKDLVTANIKNQNTTNKDFITANVKKESILQRWFPTELAWKWVLTELKYIICLRIAVNTNLISHYSSLFRVSTYNLCGWCKAKLDGYQNRVLLPVKATCSCWNRAASSIVPVNGLTSLLTGLPSLFLVCRFPLLSL